MNTEDKTKNKSLSLSEVSLSKEQRDKIRQIANRILVEDNNQSNLAIFYSRSL